MTTENDMIRDRKESARLEVNLKDDKRKIMSDVDDGNWTLSQKNTIFLVLRGFVLFNDVDDK